MVVLPNDPLYSNEVTVYLSPVSSPDSLRFIRDGDEVAHTGQALQGETGDEMKIRHLLGRFTRGRAFALSFPSLAEDKLLEYQPYKKYLDPSLRWDDIAMSDYS
ncbi:MAG: hypothetical protein PHE50_06950 [Dehalococcoidales bacterium]|nr:hypothetical protein [Dehalococcoidales bacterium]